ncbi:Lrr-gtpase of the roco family, partial [Globisporangium splendens]
MGQGQSSIPHDELHALLEFYDAMGGDRWRRRDAWKQPTIDVESWYGVDVMMGHVVAIELPANELCGRIPDSIVRLTFLRVLDLSKNRLHGGEICEIPECLGRMPGLRRLDLSCNDITGSIPTEIGRLQQLRTLQLQHNNLTGEIPESICDLKKLHKLSLRGNCMSGPIPSDIGRMTSLVFLSLRNNEFSGSIPDSIGDCKALEFLNLSSNHLSGWIPERLSDLEDLEYLYLFDNKLEGRVPGSIAKLKYLKESDFRDNRLRGELPNFLDGCSSLDAVMTKWKNRKGTKCSHSVSLHFAKLRLTVCVCVSANYKHSILGDPIPGASEPGTCASPQSSQLFLRTVEPKPENSSAMLFHPTLDHRNDSGLEDDFSGSNQIVHEFARKAKCDDTPMSGFYTSPPTSQPVPA